MITIRENTFETNSSSTHSMLIASESEYQAWERGEVFYSDWKKKPDGSYFYTKDEVKQFVVEYRKKCETNFDGFKGDFDDEDLEILQEKDFWTFDGYFDYKGEYLECDEETYTSEHGDTIHIICHYGYDG